MQSLKERFPLISVGMFILINLVNIYSRYFSAQHGQNSTQSMIPGQDLSRSVMGTFSYNGLSMF